MADRADITPELLRQLLRYEPETGKLFWRERSVDSFTPTRVYCAKHLHRYVAEYAYRHNTIGLSGEPALASVIRNADGKRLTYRELIA